MPPLFAGIPDDTTMAPTTQQLKQEQEHEQKEQKEPKQRKVEAAAAVANSAADVEEEEEELQEQQPQDDAFAQHLASMHEAALEARARLHDRHDEVLKEGRHALKTALREMERSVAQAKQLVDSRLQRSLGGAKHEADKARAAALKAEALSGKLAVIRGRVEGTEEEVEEEEGGENSG